MKLFRDHINLSILDSYLKEYRVIYQKYNIMDVLSNCKKKKRMNDKPVNYDMLKTKVT